MLLKILTQSYISQERVIDGHFDSDVQDFEPIHIKIYSLNMHVNLRILEENSDLFFADARPFSN